MNQTYRIVAFALIALLCAGLAVAEDATEQLPAASDDPRLAFLRSLAGTWETSAGDMDGHQGIFEYRVTAGGHTVEERLMAGSPMEMLTLYSMDGSELVARHYCMLGNQPRLRADKEFDGHSLTFACDGHVANSTSHDDAHIHDWTMTIAEDGTLNFVAEMIAGGETMEKPTFSLTRVD